MKWVGIHDHANTAVRWVDRESSYTWLRAFEMFSEGQAVAYLREPNYDHDIEHAVENIRYRFRTKPISSWYGDVIREAPDLILYNLCYYSDAKRSVGAIAKALPNTTHVIRIHHDVNYLKDQPGYVDCLMACDVAIAPTEKQVKTLRSIGFQGEIHVLPFGVDINRFQRSSIALAERNIDIACSTNQHPARNLPVVRGVLKKLQEKGLRAENLIGLKRDDLVERLGRTKFFWQTALTEASGSRILPEAIAAGCIPIVMKECQTTHDLISGLNIGYSLESRIALDPVKKKTRVPFGTSARLTREIGQIIAAGTTEQSRLLPEQYYESFEIRELFRILSDQTTSKRGGS